MHYGYVIYHRETTRLLTPKRFKTKAAAKAALTREAKALGTFHKHEYEIADDLTFTRVIEKWVERKNLMSGEYFMERINTPIHMSPAYETYWSM